MKIKKKLNIEIIRVQKTVIQSYVGAKHRKQLILHIIQLEVII